jgi:hypothetical protein
VGGRFSWEPTSWSIFGTKIGELSSQNRQFSPLFVEFFYKTSPGDDSCGKFLSLPLRGRLTQMDEQTQLSRSMEGRTMLFAPRGQHYPWGSNFAPRGELQNLTSKVAQDQGSMLWSPFWSIFSNFPPKICVYLKNLCYADFSCLFSCNFGQNRLFFRRKKNKTLPPGFKSIFIMYITM